MLVVWYDSPRLVVSRVGFLCPRSQAKTTCFTVLLQMIKQLMNVSMIVLQDRVHRWNAERIADFPALPDCWRGAGGRLMRSVGGSAQDRAADLGAVAGVERLLLLVRRRLTEGLVQFA